MSEHTIPIVDTHQHMWDLSEFELPWLDGEGLETIDRSFVMSDYLAATEGLNVVKSVYMEVNVAPSQRLKEAEYVIDLCQREDNPMAGAVIGASPQSGDFAAYAERFADNASIKGFRTVLNDPDRPSQMCLQRQFVENIQRLGEWSKIFDLCMRPEEIQDGVRLADLCPQTTFIIDHCGNMGVQSKDQGHRDAWMAAMREMAKRDNVFCKISGIVVTASEDWQPQDLVPNMDFCIDTFGEDRVFFASDWPVCTLKATLRQWIEALQWIVRDRSMEFQRKLFHDNASRVYDL